jgi:hypothetical protein
MRPQRRTAIDHVGRLIGLDPAAIPQIALVAGQFLGRASHENLVGGLLGAAPHIPHLPEETWFDRVDA